MHDSLACIIALFKIDTKLFKKSQQYYFNDQNRKREIMTALSENEELLRDTYRDRNIDLMTLEQAL